MQTHLPAMRARIAITHALDPLAANIQLHGDAAEIPEGWGGIIDMFTLSSELRLRFYVHSIGVLTVWRSSRSTWTRAGGMRMACETSTYVTTGTISTSSSRAAKRREKAWMQAEQEEEEEGRAEQEEEGTLDAEEDVLDAEERQDALDVEEDMLDAEGDVLVEEEEEEEEEEKVEGEKAEKEEVEGEEVEGEEVEGEEVTTRYVPLWVTVGRGGSASTSTHPDPTCLSPSILLMPPTPPYPPHPSHHPTGQSRRLGPHRRQAVSGRFQDGNPAKLHPQPHREV